MSKRRRLVVVLRRLAVAAFLAVVAVLLYRHARAIEWAEVGTALADYPPSLLLLAAVMSLASHALYAGFDLLARRHVGHGLGSVRTLAIAATSYAFNVNLGALVGGVGLRYRLYSRFGLGAGTVARIYVFCVVANWSGYVLLLAMVLAAGLVEVPPGWDVAVASNVLGVLLLLALAAWLLATARLPGRSLHFRGRGIRLPPLRTALAQLALSGANWALMGAIVWVLLGREVAYATVLGTLLLAAIAGAMAHVPAGLGVLEAVFVVVLSHQVPGHDLIAALVVYRVSYYLLPLLTGLGLYSALEIAAGRRDDGEATGRAVSGGRRT